MTKKAAKKAPSKKAKGAGLHVMVGKIKKKKGPGGPRITKGGKKGVYTTPDDLRSAVRNRFGAIIHDLAALASNKFCEKFFSPEDDAFKFSWWEIKGRCWLNPPFTFLRPWIEKAYNDARLGADIVCLVPAAVGSRWFRKFVFKKADVYFLDGRIVFDQESGTPYPKDCMIIHFHKKMSGIIDIWDWRDSMDPIYMSDRRTRRLEKEAKEAAQKAALAEAEKDSPQPKSLAGM